MPQMCQVLRECAFGMLTAGMSTRAVTRECNVNFSTISRLQHCFREFGSTFNSLTTADHVYGFVWVSGLLMSKLWTEWPMVAVGLWYGYAKDMDNKHNFILSMANRMQRDTVFQLFYGLHTHQTCHPLSMFGMLWIDIYDIVFQFPPISSNFAQPLKRSETTFHRPQ